MQHKVVITLVMIARRSCCVTYYRIYHKHKNKLTSRETTDLIEDASLDEANDVELLWPPLNLCLCGIDAE